MSAPLRTIDAESNPWLIKRRNRAKRNGQESIRIDVDQTRNHPLYFESSNRAVCKDDRVSSIRTRNKLTLKANTEIGNCDIVTLVSLLSPGASDSEKEDTSLTKGEQINSISPSSRRIEKSGNKAYIHDGMS